MSKLGVIDPFIFAPCLVKKFEGYANIMPYTEVVAVTGTSLRSAFASSTSLILHTWHTPLNDQVQLYNQGFGQGLPKFGNDKLVAYHEFCICIDYIF